MGLQNPDCVESPPPVAATVSGKQLDMSGDTRGIAFELMGNLCIRRRPGCFRSVLVESIRGGSA